MELKLEYNSFGGMDKYISTFEDLCEKMEKAEEPLSKRQKHTFFLSGIKDRDYAAIKDTCDLLTLPATILTLRKKAIKLGKASSVKKNIPRNVNNKQCENQQQNKAKNEKF